MKNVSKVIPCYAADTAGVCSAMYELGGLTVVHDASGCNSTYSTHDEPRWYDMKSRIYISALTEMDAVMGNDEKLVEDIVSAAKDQKPEFITLCGSPMPMMTGFDYEAVAREIEGRSGIRTFGIETNGTKSYLWGASQAYLHIVKEYVRDMPKTEGTSVNIIGATPLDFGLTGTVESIKKYLGEHDIEVVSCLSMGCTLDEIRRAASARANLVISYSGYEAAKYMQEKFGIPYVFGVPVGHTTAGVVASELHRAAHDGCSSFRPIERGHERNAKTVVIGEGVLAGAIAQEYLTLTRESVSVICAPDRDIDLCPDKKDLCHYSEEDIRDYLAENNIKKVIADPFYRYVIPEGCALVEVPHFAFSGRCFAKRIPDLIDQTIEDFKEFFK